ncbi:MAG: CoA-binding protein [Acidobacteriota bacterium]
MEATVNRIQDFLSRKRLAVVGVSRNAKDFSRLIFRELLNRGYDVVPVNPGATSIDDRPCFSKVQDVTPPVEGALLMVPPQTADQVVRDCLESGISQIWLHRGVGQGAVSPQAVALCRQHGASVVDGFCPFMFLPDSGWIHRFHAGFLKVIGAYPKPEGPIQEK